MNTLSSLVLPAIFGLLAGVSHGVISHYNNSPVSLSEQFIVPLNQSQQFTN